MNDIPKISNERTDECLNALVLFCKQNKEMKNFEKYLMELDKMTISLIDQWNYIFKNSKIARMSYSHVSCRYELYDRFGLKIGEIDEINLEEAKQFFELDKIPCVDIRDCFETEEESNIHFKKVGKFCQFGKVNEDLDIDNVDRKSKGDTI